VLCSVRLAELCSCRRIDTIGAETTLFGMMLTALEASEVHHNFQQRKLEYS
jgi:hypothetical protein